MVGVLPAAIAASAQSVPARPVRAGVAPIKAEVAGTQRRGGLEVLSDMQGVDFKSWIDNWHQMTAQTWYELIPKDVSSSTKPGKVAIHFKILPDGQLMEGSLTVDSSSGDEELDRSALNAIASSNYPPLPKEFQGPYLELRALFLYNMKLEEASKPTSEQ